jgi:hypothetical protein
MANRRLPVRKIKEVLRLRFECQLSEREIARSCQISRRMGNLWVVRFQGVMPESGKLFPDQGIFYIKY